MKKMENAARAVNGTPNGFKEFLKQCYCNVRDAWHKFMKTFF